MQFNTNSDFPGQNLPKEQWAAVARPPVPFEEAKFIPCVCITTRILINVNSALAAGLSNDITESVSQSHLVALNGINYLVQTAKGVLVKTPNPMSAHQGGANWSDSDDDIRNGEGEDGARTPRATGGGSNYDGLQRVATAYWLRRTLRAAIYGKVRFGIVLRKLDPPLQLLLPDASSPTEVIRIEWEATTETVAVKELMWSQIHTQGRHLAEDPVKEIAGMQHIERWIQNENDRRQQIQQQMIQLQQQQLLAMNLSHSSTQPGMLPLDTMNQNQFRSLNMPQSRLTMVDAHVMTAVDSLTDGRNLYCVMPYCSGGELFDLLEKRTKFPEAEARFWFRQILEGLTTLKAAGVAHRDLSLENLMIHGNSALIIDMGMCLGVPYNNNGQRFLIRPQGICGKWHCMSPEIYSNSAPFDGPAVDLWAAGVILFIMLTGYPPWERPCLSDDRFRYMTNGYLVHMLTEWKTGLSGDAMDLLQRIFWLDPTDRLCLEQVLAHPWMQKELRATSFDL